MFNRKLVLAFSTAALAAALALAGCGSSSTENVAAKFGDNVITEDQICEYTQQFREDNGYESDTSWSLYLGEQELTGKTWRENAIRALAEDVLVDAKAKELGITADEDAVAQRIEEAKEAYGVDADDEQAWIDALAEQGTTPEELQQTYEDTSIEQQVISKDANFSIEPTEEEMDTYIHSNLGDRVTRRWSVLTYSSKKEAQSAYNELKKLKGDALSTRFDEMATELAEKDSSAVAGDLGWDLNYSIGDKFNKRCLNTPVGGLLKGVFKNAKTYQVYLCTGRYVFKASKGYADIEDDALKSTIEALTQSSNWSTTVTEYLNQLVDSANVQVYNMPDGQPYDLTPYTSYEDAANAYGVEAANTASDTNTAAE